MARKSGPRHGDSSSGTGKASRPIASLSRVRPHSVYQYAAQFDLAWPLTLASSPYPPPAVLKRPRYPTPYPGSDELALARPGLPPLATNATLDYAAFTTSEAPDYAAFTTSEPPDFAAFTTSEPPDFAAFTTSEAGLRGVHDERAAGLRDDSDFAAFTTSEPPEFAAFTTSEPPLPRSRREPPEFAAFTTSEPPEFAAFTTSEPPDSGPGSAGE